MDKNFSVAPLTRRGARAAYSLVRLHNDSITLAAWLQYTRQFWSAAADRKGLITIRDCREIVHALYSYHVRSGPIGRRCLCITNLIMAHLAGFEIDHVVYESARQLASNLGCQTISIEQPFQPQPSAGNPLYHLSSARNFPADLRYLNENEQKWRNVRPEGIEATFGSVTSGRNIMKTIAVNADEALWRYGMLPEGVVVKWFVEDGGLARAGDRMAEVRIEGALHAIVAPASGRLKIEAKVNSVIEPGSLLATLVPQ